MSILAALVLAVDGPSRITPEGFVAKEPQVAASAARVFVACGNGDRLFVLRSENGGATFSEPVALPTAGSLSLGMRRGPRIALAGSTVVVSAVYGKAGGGQDGDLLAWRSTDAGKTWTRPVAVSDAPGVAREGLHAMAAGRSGRLACAWLDLRGQGTEVWTSLSDDGGATWTKNVRAYRSPSGTVCECCHPSLAVGPKGEIHVMFRNWLGGSRDMYLASSADGMAFSPAQKLGTGTWPINACPMDGGALTVENDGTVLTAWRRGQEVFSCRPGQPEVKLGDGTQPWISGDGLTSSVVWMGTDGRIRARNEALAEGSDPVVATVDGRGVAFWADRRGRIWSRSLP